MKMKKEPFLEAISFLNERLRTVLERLPEEWQKQISEIRLRANAPVLINAAGQNYFLSQGKMLLFRFAKGCLIATPEEVRETFQRMCEYSVYSYQKQICDGFLPLQGGHRAGFGGTAVYADGVRTGIREISSVNLRIARAIPGAADELFRVAPELTRQGGVLLAGPPNSGKTTVLRDFAHQLSNGTRSEIQRVVVVDERGELAMSRRGIPQVGEGFWCDVLDAFPKAEGILHATRALAPQIIVCDEIGTSEEAESICAVLGAGVRLAISMHAGTKEELFERAVFQRLWKSGAFSIAVLLKDGQPGRIREVIRKGEVRNERSRVSSVIRSADGDRDSEIPEVV